MDMSKIKVLIVEDELLIAEDIASKLQKAGFEVIDKVDSGEDCLKVIERKIPDLTLMDIQLSGELDGITTAGKIREKYQMPIIYLTDYYDDETVERAKTTSPANYLSKPFRENDLIRAVKIAFHNASYNAKQSDYDQTQYLLKDHVFIRTGNQTFDKIAYDDILFIKADRSYCDVFTKQKKYQFSISMKKVSEQLQHLHLVRVSRSFIVNVRNANGIEGNMLKFGDTEIQISKDYREDLFKKLHFVK